MSDRKPCFGSGSYMDDWRDANPENYAWLDDVFCEVLRQLEEADKALEERDAEIEKLKADLRDERNDCEAAQASARASDQLWREAQEEIERLRDCEAAQYEDRLRLDEELARRDARIAELWDMIDALLAHNGHEVECRKQHGMLYSCTCLYDQIEALRLVDSKLDKRIIDKT